LEAAQERSLPQAITHRFGISGRFGGNAKSRAMIDRVLAGDRARVAIGG